MPRQLDNCRVKSDGTLKDALLALERGMAKIALITDAAERLVGIITDGDVRRAFLADATLEAPLAPVMRTSFIAVDEATERPAVLDLMQARMVAQVPVVDAGGKLVGLHLLHEMLGAITRPNWAVIMAGGQGLRLRPHTERVPKPMLTVAGRPILERLILQLAGYGVRRIFIAVNYRREIIEAHFGDGHQLGVSIGYLREDAPRGTGGALSLLPETPTHPLLVLNGDVVSQLHVGQLLSAHDSSGAAATICVHEYAHEVPFGVVDVEGSRVVHFREKPRVSWTANAGIYVLSPALVERVPQNSEFDITELLEDSLVKNEHIGAFSLEGEWIDVGREAELARARGEYPRETP